jgi:hypothetical protein
MSDDDVHRSEMHAPDEFDDATAERFLAGGGRGIDPRLADALHDMRVAYSSPPAVGAELSALMSPPAAASNQPASARRFARMRSSIIAKIGVAAAAMVAATGGLAAANALPAPVQDAVSHLGIASGPHDNAPTVLAPDATTTTEDSSAIPPEVTPTSTSEPTDNHGGEVSSVAHDGSTGCEHGSTVSSAASDGRSENDAVETPEVTGPSAHDGNDVCETPTTVGTVSPNGGDHGDQTDGGAPHAADEPTGDQQHGDGSAGVTSTTTAGAGQDGSGDHHSGGSDSGGGDSHDSGSSDGSATSGSGN